MTVASSTAVAGPGGVRAATISGPIATGRTTADGVDGQVVRDTHQPGGDAGPLWVVRGGVFPGSHEGLLGYVFGQALVAEHVDGHAVDPALEPTHERRAGVGVTNGEPVEQNVVGDAVGPDRRWHGRSGTKAGGPAWYSGQG